MAAADLNAHHPPILETHRLRWPDETACAAFATRLAQLGALWPSTFIALRGPLGAGKTTWARHLLRSLGVEGRIKSPTFAVMEPYELAGGRSVAHFDFYRFDDAREWADAGFRDAFAAPGLKLAEWPERAAALLPAADLELCIAPDDAATDGDDQAPGRDVTVHACTPHGVALLAALAVPGALPPRMPSAPREPR